MNINLKNLTTKTALVISSGLVIITALIHYSMGRLAICKCGYIKLWHGITKSSENSQHITDWYTFSHIIHGFIFYWILTLFKKRLSVGSRLVIAVLIEAAWEIFENTDMVINRYRTATISLDYYGDSIINSVFDIIAMMFGFWLAARLPVWFTVTLLLLMEVIVGLLIRDNLLLNIVMPIYPFEFIKNWQMGL